MIRSSGHILVYSVVQAFGGDSETKHAGGEEEEDPLLMLYSLLLPAMNTTGGRGAAGSADGGPSVRGGDPTVCGHARRGTAGVSGGDGHSAVAGGPGDRGAVLV